MDRDNYNYLEYLVRFYSDTLRGNAGGKPLTYLEYTGDDSPTMFDDLVEIIENLKK